MTLEEIINWTPLIGGILILIAAIYFWPVFSLMYRYKHRNRRDNAEITKLHSDLEEFEKQHTFRQWLFHKRLHRMYNRTYREGWLRSDMLLK